MPRHEYDSDEAERAAAIRRSDYYDGDAIAWLRDVDEDLTTCFTDCRFAFHHTCECGAPKAVGRTACDDCAESMPETEP